MSEHLTMLRERLAQLSDLRNAGQVLSWDQQTMMPPRGGEARAEALATLERIAHDLFVSGDTGRLLEASAAALDGRADPDSDEVRLVQVVQHKWEKARRVPGELAEELAREASVGQEAWVLAREKSDFAAFAPYLERNLDLIQRYVACFDRFDCAYDVVLDDYDPSMKTAEVADLFADLRGELVPLIASVAARRVDDSCVHGDFPIESQRAMVASVLERMGFDRAAWRMDDAVHPFATSFSSTDVRITTRWDQSYFPSALYGAMHECGHGLYEAGIDAALQRTPLGHGESLSVHESQSRMWENMVGRGRPFCEYLTPRVVEAFPGLAGLDPQTLFRAVNRVEPSFIRVEADEATYSLHVVIRFELEQELIEGRLAVRDLPEAWNERYERYLGLEVTDDASGVLQDVHWAAGLLGYFPTYALGNLVAGQLWARVRTDMPDLDDQIAAGELAPLREWLRLNVHRHGCKFTTRELLDRVVGEPLSVGPFVEYLKTKVAEVHAG
jgi:carboxypeptidase Taq